MALNIEAFAEFLSSYIPQHFSFRRLIFLFDTLRSLRPLMRLHFNQYRRPNQPALGGWMREMRQIIGLAANPLELGDGAPLGPWPGQQLSIRTTQRIQDSLEDVFQSLDIDTFGSLPAALPILITPRTVCCFCANDPPLHKSTDARRVNFIDENSKYVQAWLAVAKCTICHAHFYPDRISRRRAARAQGENVARYDMLECNAESLFISKAGLWIHRSIAQTQEDLMYRHMSWAGFSDHFIRRYGIKAMTPKTSHRLFVEHFIRRLIAAYHLTQRFTCPASSSAKVKVQEFLRLVGNNGSVMRWHRAHVCSDCTHQKKYYQAENGNNVPENAVAGVHDAEEVN